MDQTPNVLSDFTQPLELRRFHKERYAELNDNKELLWVWDCPSTDVMAYRDIRDHLPDQLRRLFNPSYTQSRLIKIVNTPHRLYLDVEFKIANSMYHNMDSLTPLQLETASYCILRAIFFILDTAYWAQYICDEDDPTKVRLSFYIFKGNKC